MTDKSYMSTAQFERAILFTLEFEGLWSDHEQDGGGATMKGVTKAVYEDYLGRSVTKDELRAIPDEHVYDIYRARYWDKSKAGQLPAGLGESLFDFSVNSGVSRGVKYLQKLVGTTQDGLIGPKTIAAVDRLVSEKGIIPAVDGYNNSRLTFVRGLKNFPTFGKGWTRRINTLKAESRKWAVPGSRGDG